MEFWPKTFIEAVGGVLVVIAILLLIPSFWSNLRKHFTRFCGVMLVAALAMFNNSTGTYFASVFIIATVVTKLEFLENLAAIIRGFKPYFEHQTAKFEKPSKVEVEVTELEADVADNEIGS